jgi:hypothetical protein
MYYPPMPRQLSNPRSSGRGWLRRFFPYKDPGSATYHAVQEDEELAPLHRLHDPDPDGEDGEEDRLSSTEFEIVNREGDVK